MTFLISGDLSNKCFTTIDSPDKNVPCVIPFKFEGIERNGCITDYDPKGRHWCPTKVDQNLEYVLSAPPFFDWGFCKQSSPQLSKGKL